MRPENVLFIAQVSCISVVIAASLFNLTFQWGNQHLWTMILTSSLAAMMPSPKFRTVFNEEAEKANTQPIIIKEQGSSPSQP